MAKLMYSIVVLTTLTSMCSGSAIPMWEFLGRTEKMSHLYSMFAKEVSKYCKSIGDLSITKCKHDLLAYGVAKLEKMNESHLDAMDPYQRSANDIIWDSIMDGHPMMLAKLQSTTKAPIRQPTGLFERNPLFDGIDDDEKPQGTENKPVTVDYTSNMDTSYGGHSYAEPSNQLPFATNTDYHYDLPAVNSPSNYLIGPMIVRVKPDGSPVDEDKTKPLPVDDDRDAMTIGSGFFPSSKTLNHHHQHQEHMHPAAGSANGQPSIRLEAPPKPVAPVAQASRARFMPDTSVYTNYRTISRRNQH